MYPYAWRDYLSKKTTFRLNILNQLQGLDRPKNETTEDAPPLELPVGADVEPTIVSDEGIYLKNYLSPELGSHYHKLIQIQKINL